MDWYILVLCGILSLIGLVHHIYKLKKCVQEKNKPHYVEIDLERSAPPYTLEEWDRFIKEENDSTIKTYDIFHRIVCKRKFDEQELVDFLRVHGHHISWDDVCVYAELTPRIISEFKDKWEMRHLVVSQKLDESFIRRYKEELKIFNIFKYQRVSMKFIEDNLYLLKKQNWHNISRGQDLDKDFVKKYSKKLDWTELVLSQKFIDENMIKKYGRDIKWGDISQCHLTEDQMERYKNFLNWRSVYIVNGKYMSKEFKQKMIKDGYIQI